MLALSVSGAEIQFNFNNYPEGTTPTNFQSVLAGDGLPGIWKIVTVEVPPLLAPLTDKAPVVSRQGVLAQTGSDPTDEHFPMLIFTGEKFRNFKFTTRFKIVSGVTEQMAGLVFRYQNSSNYYVVRARPAVRMHARSGTRQRPALRPRPASRRHSSSNRT